MTNNTSTTYNRNFKQIIERSDRNFKHIIFLLIKHNEIGPVFLKGRGSHYQWTQLINDEFYYHVQSMSVIHLSISNNLKQGGTY
jgi:hypothetical protein